MKLLEHESKKILAGFSIKTPKGILVAAKKPTTAAKPHYNLTRFPVVLKSQVPVGGRGKAGGIKIVKSQAEADSAITKILNLSIKGFKPTKILAEEVLDIEKEFYISLLINRQNESVELLAHKDGGVEIESHPASSFMREQLNPGTIQPLARKLAELYDLHHYIGKFEDLLIKLYSAFTSSDATLLEINPLVLTKSGQLIAGDCKMTLDDSAAFRHPNWNFEDKQAEANFVTLDKKGTVATIANGAGLAMATVDAVANAGLSPANFLDIGGGASKETVLAAFNKIMEFPKIKGIVINIFAGITRCDEVAKAIIEARKSFKNLPPLYIRLSGTNVELAEKLLVKQGIPLLPTLGVCLDAAKQDIGLKVVN